MDHCGLFLFHEEVLVLVGFSVWIVSFSSSSERGDIDAIGSSMLIADPEIG